MSLTIESLPVPLRLDEHGVARVGGTRVTLESVLAVYERDGTADDVVEAFPTLTLADVHSVLAFYLLHTAEVDEYLRQRNEFAAEIRNENESRFDLAWIRERIRERRNRNGA